MFWKKEQQSLEVVIGPDSGIRGDVTTKGVVKLDGVIDGCVSADWLIVGETGKIKGDVSSRGTVVYGRIEGNIKSNEIIEIRSKAVVEGDIYTTKLIVSEGALFDGRSHMQRLHNTSSNDVVSLEQKTKKGVLE
jgi:cytoskeletal protein CcmA (bactofilin family)